METLTGRAGAALMSDKTLFMIKSGAIMRKQTMAILACPGILGYTVLHYDHKHLTVEQVREFYAEHVNKDFWPMLQASVMGPDGVIVGVLQGPAVILGWRRMMGATNPAIAHPGTLRHDFGSHDFGSHDADNAVHGSDSAESAYREIRFIFPDHPALIPNKPGNFHISDFTSGMSGAVATLLG